jgi:hypothetical protein
MKFFNSRLIFHHPSYTNDFSSYDACWYNKSKDIVFGHSQLKDLSPSQANDCVHFYQKYYENATIPSYDWEHETQLVHILPDIFSAAWEAYCDINDIDKI